MKRNRNLACALLIAQTAVLAGCTQNTDQNVKSKVEASIPSVSIA